MAEPQSAADRIRDSLTYDVVDFDDVRQLLEDHARLAPPRGLPAVLSSVDDVARVCEAAGLTETDDRWPNRREWRGGGVRVTSCIDDDVPMCTGVSPDPRPLNNAGHADLWPGTSVLTMWSAIQAARGGEPRG